MKIITIETLKAFLDELNKKYGTEFYSKTEADNKYQSKGDAYTKEESDERYQPKGESSGGSADYAELARRIPSWQWKVTLPETVNQTVTATIGSQTYTRDFYAQQGSQIAFSVTPDPGYIAGIVSPKSVTLTSDLTTVTVTEATESGDVEAGTKTFRVNGDGFAVPPAVHVLKWTWDGKDIYTKVIPGYSFGVVVISNPYPDMPNKPAGFYYSIIDLGSRNKDLFSDLSSEPLSVAWSQEINEHAFDYDWTK